MNELLILFFLKENSYNIYELRKVINSAFLPFFQISTGALIPALKRLEQQEYIGCVRNISDGGLRKTVYSILDKGNIYFDLLLSQNLISAPQITRRDMEILFMLLENQTLNQEQNEKIVNILKTSLSENIKSLENAISDNKMNLEFLNMELVYSEAKLRFLKELCDDSKMT